VLHYTFKCFCYFVAIIFYTIVNHTNSNAVNISNVRFWNTIHGLQNRVINCIVKDPNGYIWLGTQNGLIRFDGRTFLRYSQIEANNLLDNEPINSLSILNNTELWVGSDKGLYKINIDTYASEDICLPQLALKCKGKTEIRVIYTGSSNVTFIGGDKGVSWIMQRGQIKQITNPYSNDSCFEDITSAVEDRHKNIWFTTARKQLYVLNLKTQKITHQKTFTRDIYYVNFSPETGIVISSIGGIYKVDTAISNFPNQTNLLYPKANIIKFEGAGKHWVTLYDQQLVYYNNKSVQDVTSIFNIMAEPNYSIKCIYKHNNDVWIGTNFGLIKFTPSEQNIEHLFRNTLFKNDRKNHSVRGICELPDNSILMATYEGIFKSALPYTNYELIIPEKKFGFVPYALASEKSTLWIASEGSGLIKYDLNTKKASQLNNLSLGIKPRFLLCIYNDTNQNRLLLGSYAGLIIFDKRNETFTKKPINVGEINIDHAMIYQINFIDSIYWICTSKGVIKCDANLNPLPISKQLTLLNNVPVTSLLKDKVRNILWVGSLGKGLYSINLKTNNIDVYNFKMGFANDFIAGMEQTDPNTIWATTYNGVCKINAGTKTFVNLYSEHGLSHNEFNHNATFVTRNGTLLMGGLNGYNIIRKNIDIKNIPSTNKIFISKIYQLNGHDEITLNNCPENYTINLPTNNKILEIEFGLDDYNQPENNAFSYMLEGVDNDWIYIGNKNFIRYIDIKPGSYKLMIKASGTSGKLITKLVTLNINADGYLYKKWWFILLVFISVLITVVIFFRLKLTRLNNLADLRLQISSDLHDEVGSILTAVGMQAEMLKSGNNQQNMVALNKIAETSRTAVSNMRDVVWSIDARNDKCSDLIDRMHEYIALIFDGESIQHTFNKYIDYPNHQIELVIRQNTYLIFKEALNNIVKHSNATNVLINFTYNNKVLHLIIENNGTPKGSVNKMGMGIRNMEMRATKMKAEISIEPKNSYKIELIKRF
jgi:ligand-binding sensor domain-containing protein